MTAQTIDGNALPKQLRAEVALHGVRVSVICPSFFRTNLCDTAIGRESVRTLAMKLMERSPDSLDAVADRVFACAQAGRFLILPTRREPMRWRLKRWFPALYFRMIMRMSRRMQAGSDKAR